MVSQVVESFVYVGQLLLGLNCASLLYFPVLFLTSVVCTYLLVLEVLWCLGRSLCLFLALCSPLSVW